MFYGSTKPSLDAGCEDDLRNPCRLPTREDTQELYGVDFHPIVVKYLGRLAILTVSWHCS